MMVESITFNFADSKIIVNLINGTSETYTKSDKDAYLYKYPNRGADVISMGW